MLWNRSRDGANSLDYNLDIGPARVLQELENRRARSAARCRSQSPPPVGRAAGRPGPGKLPVATKQVHELETSRDLSL